MKVIVEADGGSRGNPGPAGYGSVVFTADRGVVLAESKQAIGRATNNVAEYRGLIAGLDAAIRLGASPLVVYMDSELVVRQMTGEYRVKHEGLKPLHAEAAQRADQLKPVRFVAVRRGQNERADQIVNDTLDKVVGSRAPG